MAKEIWKVVPGYPNYMASNLGRIKSFAKKTPIILKSFMRKNYLILGLNKNGVRTTFGVHQVVAMAFLGHVPCGHGLIVEHKNHITTDNRLSNLKIITQRENSDQKHLPSASKYTGVIKCREKWTSKIRVKNKIIHLGVFETELEASKYYEMAIASLKNGTEILIKKHQYSSRYKNVMYDAKYKKWKSQVALNGKSVFLGHFDNEEDARDCSADAIYNFENGKEVVRKLTKQKASKYKWVFYRASLKKWIARITIDGKRKHIGTFNTDEDANEAVVDYLKKQII